MRIKYLFLLKLHNNSKKMRFKKKFINFKIKKSLIIKQMMKMKFKYKKKKTYKIIMVNIKIKI